MNTFLIVIAVLIASFGGGVAIWSLIDTRKKYYEEYLSRKRNQND